MPRVQSTPTVLKHLRAILRRTEDWDCTSLAEDKAIRTAIEIMRAKQGLINDLWWFIENVSDETPDRTDLFFALRQRVRETSAGGIK